MLLSVAVVLAVALRVSLFSPKYVIMSSDGRSQKNYVGRVLLLLYSYSLVRSGFLPQTSGVS